MNLTKNIWGHTERPWGYEVRVDFTDEKDFIHNEVLTFDSEPSDNKLSDAINSLKTRLEERIIFESFTAAIEEDLQRKGMGL